MKWTRKLKRSVKELIGGRNTYMPKGNKNRTEQIKKQAESNFGTDLQAELKKLRNRGKQK